MEYAYYPIFRTRNAELEALRHSDLQKLLPIFELTRSRITQKDKEGSIAKNIEKILELKPNQPFILDFTTEKEFTNTEIRLFAKKNEGFDNWYNFCLSIKEKNNKIIPCLALINNPNDSDLKAEFEKFLFSFNLVAIRLPLSVDSLIFNEKMFELINKILQNFEKDKHKFLFILDFGYVSKAPLTEILFKAKDLINDFIRRNSLEKNKFILLSSSFPKSVSEITPRDEGYFPIKEFELYKQLKPLIANNSLIYGDYGSIHPLTYASYGGSWIPRVDIPYLESYFFYKCRRDDGGYEDAASRAIIKVYEEKIDSSLWGIQEIIKASEGDITKKIPSFWISVRINLYLSNVFKVGILDI
ncbi:MAG: hypothetical protein E7019_06475 [Alphaproteobacteria bacterium]|nr:hypothetical protein [Alphaproteobacteria bacterium]